MPIIQTEEMPIINPNGSFTRGNTIFVYRLPMGSQVNVGFLLRLIRGNSGDPEWKEVVKKDFSLWTDFKKKNKTSDLQLVENSTEEKIISDWLKSKEEVPNKKMIDLIMLHRSLGYRGELKFKN